MARAQAGAAARRAQGGSASAGSKRKLRELRGGGVAPANELDDVIHQRFRLGIVSALAVNEALTFNELKQLLGTTDGNLSVHARKLEEASYITCHKSFEGRVPKTEYALTRDGRRALERYLEHMEALITAVKEA